MARPARFIATTAIDAGEAKKQTGFATWARSRPKRLRAGDGQLVDAQGRRIGAGAEFEVACGNEAGEHVFEVAGDGHFADREGDRAVLDPETGGAAAVIA